MSSSCAFFPLWLWVLHTNVYIILWKESAIWSHHLLGKFGNLFNYQVKYIHRLKWDEWQFCIQHMKVLDEKMYSECFWVLSFWHYCYLIYQGQWFGFSFFLPTYIKLILLTAKALRCQGITLGFIHRWLEATKFF